MPKAYISIGGNINPQQHIEHALLAFGREFKNLQSSPIYESIAVGFEGDNFLNLVVSFDTHLSVGLLNTYLHDLEDVEGRERTNGKAWDSRTLDLDILLYGNQAEEKDGIALPRGEILDHAHVLMPLVDLAGDELHPQEKKTYKQILCESCFADQKIWKVSKGFD